MAVGPKAEMKLGAVTAVLVLCSSGFAAEAPVSVVSADGVVLRSDTHAPIPGARVRLTPPSPADGEGALGWETTTDESGRFLFPAIPARRMFAVNVRGPALALHRPIDLVATGHTARHFRPIEVPPSIPHAGVVRDLDGKPLAGATVELFVHRSRALRGSPARRRFEARETRKLPAECERFPRVRGRVFHAGGIATTGRLLWLRVQILDAGGQPKEGEEGIDVPLNKDGSFEVFLRDGSHQLSLFDQEDPGIENLPPLPVDLAPARRWKIAGAGRLEVLRGRDVDGLEVLLEQEEGTP